MNENLLLFKKCIIRPIHENMWKINKNGQPAPYLPLTLFFIHRFRIVLFCSFKLYQSIVWYTIKYNLRSVPTKSESFSTRHGEKCRIIPLENVGNIYRR